MLIIMLKIKGNKAFKTNTGEAFTSGTKALLANLDLRQAPMSFPSGQKIS